MKTPLDPETATRRVVWKYHKLYKPLIELFDALQNLEPNGIIVDQAVLRKTAQDSPLRIEYKARPLVLKIVEGKRVFVLRVSEEDE